jgi:hypothetical protein
MDARASLIVVILLTSAGGCAGGQGGADYGTASPQREAAEQRADYRTQASSLRQMADRRQLEADLLAREVGPNDPAVEKKRRLAEELRAAAVEAENDAREAGRQVPHGMVQ